MRASVITPAYPGRWKKGQNDGNPCAYSEKPTSRRKFLGFLIFYRDFLYFPMFLYTFLYTDPAAAIRCKSLSVKTSVLAICEVMGSCERPLDSSQAPRLSPVAPRGGGVQKI